MNCVKSSNFVTFRGAAAPGPIAEGARYPLSGRGTPQKNILARPLTKEAFDLFSRTPSEIQTANEHFKQKSILFRHQNIHLQFAQDQSCERHYH